MSAVEAYIDAALTAAERDARRQYMTALRRRMDEDERGDVRRIEAWQDESRGVA